MKSIKRTDRKVMILAAMALALAIAFIASVLIRQPVQAQTQAQTQTAADYVRMRSALLERLLVAKRFGIEREDFEKALEKIDRQYTKSNDLDKAFESLQSLDQDLEKRIKEKVDAKQQSSAESVPPLNWKVYAAELNRRIPCSWYPPKCCSKKTSAVSFELHPDGNVSNLKLLAPTDNKEMDLSVERAVKNASPFAKFSSEKQFEKVIFHFSIGRPSKAELVK
ncbi:MAG: TonB family protein [Cyanobacteriota/Melainabacteria group bacterium]